MPTGNDILVKTAFNLALVLDDGQVTGEESGLPARGTPLRVVVRWQPDILMDPDRWVEVDASQLVANRVVDRVYPPCPTSTPVAISMSSPCATRPVTSSRKNVLCSAIASR